MHVRCLLPLPGARARFVTLLARGCRRRSAFPDFKLTAGNLVGEGDFVSISWHGSGIHQGTFLGSPGSGRPIEVPPLKEAPRSVLQEARPS